MRQHDKPFWSPAPFLRLLIPLTAGILAGFYYSISLPVVCLAGTICFLCIILFYFFPSAKKYRARWLTGWCLNLLLVCTGIFVCYTKDIRHQKNWLGYYPTTNATVLVSLQEPLVEKEKSYKAIASAEAIFIHNRWQPVTGKLLVYFRKDSLSKKLQYGSRVVFQAFIQPVVNTGNPGAFDYRQYCAFQDIYHQVFLQPADYRVLAGLHAGIFTKALFHTVNRILSVLKKCIPGEKEAGVAEALLIGYRNDLDKDLVQSYSNTGVVHIIAISGLHLGMIYGLLIFLLKPISKLKSNRWLNPLIILAVLWGFSLLTGAAASILRSAVMFSFIVIGKSLDRRTHIYNTLAASAFCLLIYNPYFLWDVGFQLSYAAVLSIVLFMKPVYQWFYLKNKILDTIWQLNAVTLSAQVLTLPMILFYFHQFPNFFLFTNFVAVPLSGFILYGELLLLLFASIPILGSLTGRATAFLITQMDGYIERTARLPFSVTANIHISVFQAIILYLCISAAAWWLLQVRPKALCMSLAFFCICMLSRTVNQIKINRQHKLIVYNIPKHTAIDVIEGTRYQLIGDSLLYKGALPVFHLNPARIQLGVEENGALAHTFISGKLVATHHTRVLIIDQWLQLNPAKQRIPVDIIILANDPNISLHQLAAAFNCTQYVFAGSNSLWKIRYWKKEADSLHLRHHSTSEQGAFEVDL